MPSPLARLADLLTTALRAAPRTSIVAIAVVVIVALVTTTEACAAPATGPDLDDGRVRIIMGVPKAKPGAKPRRIYPTGTSPRGVTLVATRASTPAAWYSWEYDAVQLFAKRHGYRTWTTKPRGFDLTRYVTGREYRVDPRILAAVNRVAASKVTTCTVVSGWRDSSKQLALWLGWVARLPGFNPANPPGTSKHEALPKFPARAADVYCNGVMFWNWARGAGVATRARALGLTEPYRHEPWHVELATG